MLDNCVDTDNRACITVYRDSTVDLEKNEEILWKQRSREKWVLEGDRNMCFFHSVASQRWLNNAIHMVLDEAGNEIHDQNGIVDVFDRYFKGLFSTSNPSSIQSVVSYCNSRLSSNQVHFLETIYMDEEVNRAIFYMKTNKMPCLYSVNVGFYRKN